MSVFGRPVHNEKGGGEHIFDPVSACLMGFVCWGPERMFWQQGRTVTSSWILEENNDTTLKYWTEKYPAVDQ